MCFFHLIEQHDAVRMAAHSLGQLAALLVADVSRRRADQTGDAEFLHVLGHVDTHHVLLIVEQGLRQRLGQLGLADAGGAQEQEAADRSVRISNTGTRAQDGVRHLLHSLVLADDALMQHVRQAQQLFALALHQLSHRDAGPAGHDAGDLLIGHAVTQQAGFLLFLGNFLLGFQFTLQLRQLAVLQFAGLGIIAGTGSLFNLRLGVFNVSTQTLHLVDGVLLVFPLGLLAVEAVAEFGHLLFQSSQALLGKFVGLLL